MGENRNEGVQLSTETLAMKTGDQLRGNMLTEDSYYVYIASNTRSSDFPVSTGAYDISYNGGITDGVVFKFNTDLSILKWSTFLGGIGQDVALSIQVDSLGGAIVAGGTSSNDFPTTPGVLN